MIGLIADRVANRFSTFVDNYIFNYLAHVRACSFEYHNMLYDYHFIEKILPAKDDFKKNSAYIRPLQKKRSLSEPEASLLYGFFMQ